MTDVSASVRVRGGAGAGNGPRGSWRPRPPGAIVIGMSAAHRAPTTPAPRRTPVPERALADHHRTFLDTLAALRTVTSEAPAEDDTAER